MLSYNGQGEWAISVIWLLLLPSAEASLGGGLHGQHVSYPSLLPFPTSFHLPFFRESVEIN